MLGADLMIRTFDGPLKEAPYAFYGVRMNITTNPLFGAVVNGLVCCVGVGDPNITGGFISHPAFSLGINSLCHECMEHFLLAFLRRSTRSQTRAFRRFHRVATMNLD